MFSLLFMIILNDLRRGEIELNHGVFDVTISGVASAGTVSTVCSLSLPLLINHLYMLFSITKEIFTGLNR